MEFMREFPDDETCLQWLWVNRCAPDGDHAYCPKCETARRFRRYATTNQQQAWTCTSCTAKLYPTAGTIFHKSSTSLQLWFYAMWIMTSTRCGVSAKQLERELGVTYKTAWRMFNLIRNRLMVQDYTGPLSGEVEVDETWVGGKMRQSETNAAAKRHAETGEAKIGQYVKPRATVFGMVERSGRIVAMTMPSRYGYNLRTKIRDNIALGTFKNGVRGVYHSVSVKWLQGYVNEYVWRYNHRDDGAAMFKTLLKRACVS